MSILPIGPDGMIVVSWLLVSAIVALLIRRQVGSAKMVLIVLAAAMLLARWRYSGRIEPADMVRQGIRASFVIVPSVVLLAGARVTWLTQRAWSFVLIGPLTFVLCYTAICELCYRAGLI